MGQFPEITTASEVPTAHARPGWWVLAGASLALAGTLLLYGNALRLPFFFDDMVHLRWEDWHSLLSIWTTAEGLGYYRPLTMSVWKLDQLLFGANDQARLHLLSLLLHALNAVLAGGIAWRAYLGKARVAYAFLAMALFLTFPFSYQAVPSTSSLSKPLIATLTLGSALLYWQARRRRSPWLLGFSLLLACLTPFAYESGVMTPVAILAVEILACSRREFERWSWWPALYMVLIWGGALPLIVHMEPDTGASLALPSLLSLRNNGIYFLEGLLFPISFAGTFLQRLSGLDQYLVLSLLILAGAAALFAFFLWARQLRLLLYALSWFVVGVLPQWLMLDFAYVITSPRLHYLGAMGAVLLWAGVPILLWTRVPTRPWSRLLAMGVAVAMLAFGSAYVQDKMALAGTIGPPLWQAVHAAEGFDRSDSLLYVNVPSWIAPKEAVYRVGTEGLTFIPEYVRVQDLIYVNGGGEPEVRAFTFDPAKQDHAAYIGYAGEALDWEGLAREIRRADGVYLTTYPADGLRFVLAGELESGQDLLEREAGVARFADQIVLADYELAQENSTLVLDLWWFALAPPEQDVTVFVHVYDGNGQRIAQADGYPLLGLFPPVRWLPGDTVHDVRYVPLPEGLAGGPLSVILGWYDTSTGQRVPAFDRQGQPAADDAIRLSSAPLP